MKSTKATRSTETQESEVDGLASRSPAYPKYLHASLINPQSRTNPVQQPSTNPSTTPHKNPSTIPQQHCHPERSASQIDRLTQDLQREVEGPRRCLSADAFQGFPEWDATDEVTPPEQLRVKQRQCALS